MKVTQRCRACKGTGQIILRGYGKHVCFTCGGSGKKVFDWRKEDDNRNRKI